MNADTVLRLFLARIEGDNRQWPIPSEQAVHSRLLRWIAHFEADRDVLKALHPGWKSSNRHYRVDPLAPKISAGWADLLFGDPPEIEAKQTGNQALLDELVKASRLPVHLRRAEEMCSSEGEVWWRGYLDPDLAFYPLVGFHSRVDVLPYYVGDRLVAAAFVTRLENEEPRDRRRKRQIYRLLEIHLPGEIRNLLYLGRDDRLGEEVPLEQGGEETARLLPQWRHELPGLFCGRIVNRLGRDPNLGVSDYQRIEDDLWTLNEAASIGHENMRLSAKKRLTGPRELLDERAGTFDAGEDYLPTSTPDRSFGDASGGGKVETIEYGFDPNALVVWQEAVVKRAATRSDMSPQWIGEENAAGHADTGVALRVKLIPQNTAGKGRGRFWDEELPRMISFLQILDAAPRGRLGFERPWSGPAEPPTVTRRHPIEPDPIEQTDQDIALVDSGLESRRTVRERRHPDWTPERQAEEDRRVRQERESAAEMFGLTSPNPERPSAEDRGNDPPQTG